LEAVVLQHLPNAINILLLTEKTNVPGTLAASFCECSMLSQHVTAALEKVVSADSSFLLIQM
jgi:hypothetical protein